MTDNKTDSFGTATRHSVELPDRLRPRFERIKAECSDEHIPEPTDEMILESLMDTWDAVNDGHYTEEEA